MKKVYIISTLVALLGLSFLGYKLELFGSTMKYVSQNKNGVHIEEKMINVDGQTIYFKRIGDKDKPPLLMLHGYGGSSDGFSAVFLGLSERFSIIAVDMVSFGRSSKPAERLSSQDQASMYNKIMEKLGYDQFSVLGHSMGGRTALFMSYLYPERISNLILVDSGGVESLTLEAGGLPPQVNDSLDDTSEVMDFDESAVINPKASETNDSGQNRSRQAVIPIPVTAIKANVLIIWGRDDGAFPWQNGEKMNEMIPNSEFHVIENGVHAPFREHAEEFNGYINNFMETHLN